MRIEEKILANLIYNEKYCRKVAPFIDSSYFTERNEQIVSQEILGFFNKYNKLNKKPFFVFVCCGFENGGGN